MTDVGRPIVWGTASRFERRFVTLRPGVIPALLLFALLALAGCAAPASPTSTQGDADSPPQAPAVPAGAFDDPWGGTGAGWDLGSTECVDVSALTASPRLDELAAVPGTDLSSAGCLYSNDEDDYAIGYFFFPTSGLAEGVSDTVVEVFSMGPTALQFPQLAVEPNGCSFFVPMYGNNTSFLGITVNSAEQSIDDSCVEAVAHLRTIATQGAYVDPNAPVASPTCEELDPLTDEVKQKFADAYFRGDLNQAGGWAWQECGIDFEA